MLRFIWYLVIKFTVVGLCGRGGDFFLLENGGELLVKEWSVIPCIGICAKMEICWSVTQIPLDIGGLIEKALKS